ncbi:MAG TPA: winged helix-turn-helix domain-containing protein [Ktedonobacterales bacterium]|nr:winged helix-turn-helix domain-containing protein [Ktedonobacterales bacterium]
MDIRTDPRVAAPRVVDLRRGRTLDIEILASETYDFLISLHVALASAEHDYADYDVGREWIESARARCHEANPEALAILGRYLGDGQPGSLHATLISLVHRCPPPREPLQFLAWLTELPSAQLTEVLLDQEGLGADWCELLAETLEDLAGPDGAGAAYKRLLARYPDDMRPTVAAVLGDLEGTRAELLAALRVWYDAVFAAEQERIGPLLRQEAKAMERRRAEMPLEAFIEQSMRGVQWQSSAGLRRIVFAPSYFCRPAVLYHVWHGTMTFCAPLVYSTPDPHRSDPRAPDEETLRFFLALGDPSRLRILRLLAERQMYLTELAERMELTKATTKHHMVKLRDAGLVTLYDRERMTYYELRPDIVRHARQLLTNYLEQPSE